jgi:GT2 family glycosyltransferase
MIRGLRKPLISIVVINYNAADYLNSCLNSVLTSSYDNFEIIVVDNGSTDSSRDLINRLINGRHKIRAIFNSINLGPAAARNQAVRQAKGEYIAFLDNDTTVDPDWLNEALRVFETDAKIGACQCKLLLAGSDKLIDCVGEYLGQNGFLVQEAIAGEEKDIGQYDVVLNIFAAKSAGMIIRMSLFKEIGGFDADYFIYLEETDLCWRVWLMGYRVVLAPRAIVYHRFGTSSVVLADKVDYLTKFHGTKNYITTLLKNLDSKSLLKILPVHLSIWLGAALFFLIKNKTSSTKWIIQGIIWNLKNIRKIKDKRLFAQSLRTVPDKKIFYEIMKKKDFGYFLAKIRRNKTLGNATGWNKEYR